MVASLRRKKGIEGRENEAWQGNENHGSGRSQWSSRLYTRRNMRRKRYASRSEVAVPTLVQMVTPEAPRNLIGDNAHDSDKLDEELNRYGIELMAPQRSNRKNRTQDLRRLRRYRRPWKVEGLFACL